MIVAPPTGRPPDRIERLLHGSDSRSSAARQSSS
jgi:hypothetical protein